MSRPAIDVIEINGNLTLLENHPDQECRTVNWWVYDERAGMNIGLRAATREAALVEAIEYWAEQACDYRKAYGELKAKVDAFVGQVDATE